MTEPAHRSRSMEHVWLTGFAENRRYQPPSRDFSGMRTPTRPSDVRGHGSRLGQELRAVEQACQLALQAEVGAAQVPDGIYISVSGRDGFLPEVEKLRSAGLLVLAHPTVVAEAEQVDGRAAAALQQQVTVFIPHQNVSKVLGKLKAYEDHPDRPENEALINRIGAFHAATLRSFWTDAPERFPARGRQTWWEVWLRTESGVKARSQELIDTAQPRIDEFREIAARLEMRVARPALAFADRAVVLAQGSPEQFERLLLVCNFLAELRMARPHPRPYQMMERREQGEWANDLVARMAAAPRTAPAVCLLDTGVNHGHPLISPSLSAQDANAAIAAWGTADHDGHGTEMAGIALFGDELPDLLLSTQPVQLGHRLESVKILPPRSAAPTDPDLYGAVTRDAVSEAEAHAPHRTHRAFSLAVTAEEAGEPGEPTSWSAAIDALAAGRVIDPRTATLNYDLKAKNAPRRLFLVATGNIDQSRLDHVAVSKGAPVEDPAQAWNALTVGAWTSMSEARLQDDDLDGALVVARPGDLSPYSRTSVPPCFKGWPLKPEILMEGGNKYTQPGSTAGLGHDDLMLLTANAKIPEALFTVTGMTSAAVSQAARMAALIQAEYRLAWPETVRALLVHSARWTAQMERHLPDGKKSTAEEFVRTFGFGVPNLARALRSARDALTLVCEEVLSPYNEGAYGDMHFYELPWPVSELRKLGSEPVRLRVTLSYFVDPYPVRKEGEHMARYPSARLRYDFKRPLEEPADFLQRINERELVGERPGAPTEQGEWFLGYKARHLGSLHHDVWSGTASELADKGVLAVTPVAGWMRDAPRQRQGREMLRYALVISIETTTVDADLAAEVNAQLLPAEVAADIP